MPKKALIAVANGFIKQKKDFNILQKAALASELNINNIAFNKIIILANLGIKKE